MKTHEIRVFPVFFEGIVQGKNELLAPGQGYNFDDGDTVLLREGLPTGEFTGRETFRKIATFETFGDNIKIRLFPEGYLFRELAEELRLANKRIDYLEYILEQREGKKL